jgi:Tfp pilus assembly protein PilO
LLQSGAEGREYRRLRDQLADMTESIGKLHAQLQSPQHEAAFVAELRGMADGVDLEIVNTQIGVTKTLPTHSQREVALDCYGSYASICQFLQQAEQFAKTTKLSKFALSATDNSDRYPIQLTFVLYSEGNSHDTKQKRGVL